MGIENIEALINPVEDEPSSVEIPMPTKPGWYAYSGGNQNMIFLLRDRVHFDIAPGVTGTRMTKLQWSVHLDNGDVADCEWGYIEQALGVWDLVKIDPTHRDDLIDFADWLSGYVHVDLDVMTTDEAVDMYLEQKNKEN